ncbi:MAG: 50S ribosomal protein L10, partial [Lachnospiraceae bacterium]|nr:50S ribosomal protein L10 [Lachnospiraceae bacterium]
MAKVELKQPIVDEIKGLIADAKTAVLVDYRGLTVEQDTKLRRELREAGVVYKVYKNTLIKRAVEGTEFESLNSD